MLTPVPSSVHEPKGDVRIFTSVREDWDLAPLLKGLPGNSCQCPHWGYVTAGRLTVRYSDREEVIEPGDAFYTPPGHVPAAWREPSS